MPNSLNDLTPAKPMLALALLALLALSLTALAAAKQEDDRLLDKREYRSELEEVIVVGKQPEWRTKSDQDQEWRPDRFELPEPENKGRIEWFPEYTKDERDNYNGVRDRTGEKPEFKIFEWKF